MKLLVDRLVLLSRRLHCLVGGLEIGDRRLELRAGGAKRLLGRCGFRAPHASVRRLGGFSSRHANLLERDDKKALTPGLLHRLDDDGHQTLLPVYEQRHVVDDHRFPGFHYGLQSGAHDDAQAAPQIGLQAEACGAGRRRQVTARLLAGVPQDVALAIDGHVDGRVFR